MVYTLFSLFFKLFLYLFFMHAHKEALFIVWQIYSTSIFQEILLLITQYIIGDPIDNRIS